MCGLAGFLGRDLPADHECAEIVARMADTLVHRGPDDAGTWVNAQDGIALGFRRLAIIDVTPAGHQPMVSESGRYVIVFNGEVYNFASIREALAQAGHSCDYRGHSDTEVMLAAIERWGLEAAVGKFLGMFAFALWDRKLRRLHLVRDRLGVKPLSYGWAGGTLLFGSELRAFVGHPGFRPEVDRASLSLLMRFGYLPAPHAIYEGVRKVRPGTILSFSPTDMRQPIETTYWSARQACEAAHAAPFTGSEEEAMEQLDQLLHDSVRLRMISDVPLGVLLSGGIDSTAVAAVMQSESRVPVKSFTLGFDEAPHDEAAPARAVARHLGTQHTETRISGTEALSLLPKVVAECDEPFADSSYLPTYLISALARQHVTVALSGDGADELFGGYTRYFAMPSRWRKVGWMPAELRSTLAKILRGARAGRKVQSLAELLDVAGPEQLYRDTTSDWSPTDGVVLNASPAPPTAFDELPSCPPGWTFEEWVMLTDVLTYLPDDILFKVDRASMAASLEAREPLLDHRLVELAWRLPLRLKMRGHQGKWILRRLLSKYVPPDLFERPKRGFSLPLAEWLRGPLRDWAESLLDEHRMRQEGFFDAEKVRSKWREHLSGSRNWHPHLWDVITFQLWHARQSQDARRQRS